MTDGSDPDWVIEHAQCEPAPINIKICDNTCSNEETAKLDNLQQS